jgi:hypothetical protein
MFHSFAPILNDGSLRRSINFDGLEVLSDPKNDNTWGAYLQLFRDGSLETAADGYLWQEGNTWLFRHVMLCQHLFESLPRQLAGLSGIGIDPPYVVMITLQKIGKSVVRLQYHQDFGPVDRDSLIVAPITITTSVLEGEWHRYLRPALDSIFNAYGLERAMGFDENDNWRPKGQQ